MTPAAQTVLVLGCDGYLGWPMSMHLSRLGHSVVAVDNLSRRQWDLECGTHSLVPIATMEQRVARWHELTGCAIDWELVDLCDAEGLVELLRRRQPDAVIDFAEQCSAPFSMVDREHAVRTQMNNVVGTLNLMFGIHDVVPGCHLIKMGTMGEYGSPNIDIEEGFIDINHHGRSDRLPYPKSAQSFYHLSKVHDSNNLHFGCRVWGLRVTNLNQGIVYGAATEDTVLDPLLATRLNFDTIWGTVLNRFCAQAAAGLPLTVYGKGGQTRGYLDIRDTIACTTLALDHPPPPGKFRVFNQFTEQFSVLQLAELVVLARREFGLEASIRHLPNPRVEQEDHYYQAKHRHLLDLGLRPHLLGATLLTSLIGMVERYSDRIDRVLIEEPSVTWQGGGNELWRCYADPRHAATVDSQLPTHNGVSHLDSGSHFGTIGTWRVPGPLPEGMGSESG